MNDTAGVADPGDDVDPKPITRAEYDGCKSALLSNINNGHLDPLLELSSETKLALRRLAFTNIGDLEELERSCKRAIRDRGDGEPAAKAFNLKTYVRWANQRRKQLQEKRAQAAKMRQRNLRLVRGGKDEGGTAVELPDDAATDVVAKAEAKNSFLRAVGLLESLYRGRVWWDTFYSAYFSDWDGTKRDAVIPATKISDAFHLSVYEHLLMMDVQLASLSPTMCRNAVYHLGNQDRRCEPRDWLRGLKWDGVERLPSLLSSAYGTPNDDYHQAVGRCWFVSMAARVMDPGCKVDTMPVLIGPQGASKSTSLEIIGGRWYRAINISAEGKDFMDALRGVLVGEIAELDAINANRVTNSRVKALLSTKTDSFRKAYGHETEDYKRTVVLAGTTNKPGWHNDDTGGRRFWPFWCVGLINVAWLKENREQLFAEALVRYERGEKWWDVPSDLQAEKMEEQYSGADDPWEERIEAALEQWGVHRGVPNDPVSAIKGDLLGGGGDSQWGTLVTTDRILTQALMVDVNKRSPKDTRRVAAIMRRLGWEIRTVRCGSGRAAPTPKAWVVAVERRRERDLFNQGAGK